MIYVINGDESYLVNENLEKIVKENANSSIIRFNGLDKTFTIRDMIASCTNVDLFSEKTLVIVRDPYFLINKINEDEHNELMAYCDSPVYDNDLVFYTMDNSFNERLRTFKDIVKNARHIKSNRLKKYDFNNACAEIVKNRNMRLKRDIYNSLVEGSNCSLTLFVQNLDVLELYPEEIDTDVLSSLQISDRFEDVYAMINALTAKKISKAMALCKKLLTYDDNVIGLVSLLSSQLRFLYEVGYYARKGDGIDMIMDRTGSKSRYRIEKALEALRSLKNREIITLLDRLADLDYQLKTNSNIDNKLRFELFISKMIGDPE